MEEKISKKEWFYRLEQMLIKAEGKNIKDYCPCGKNYTTENIDTTGCRWCYMLLCDGYGSCPCGHLGYRNAIIKAWRLIKEEKKKP